MDERFMQLPPEVIIATIEHNQRYFPVFGSSVGAPSGATGSRLKPLLQPLFITVSNIQSKDVKQVIAGNERVVRPRLTDALFFWEQDRKKKLPDYLPGLDNLTFQKELGSVGDKSRRITKLAAHIAGLLHENVDTIERAAALCKADLVTRMVFEIPELQGIMGGYYAEASGEPKAVADAIREHYQPVQSGGAIPATRAGQIVALADKVDTLAGIFAIGQKPTASKDPFALRRAAIGVWRILKEAKLPLGTGALLRTALQLQPAGKRDDQTFRDLNEFVGERFRHLLLEEGVRPEEYDAISELKPAPPHVLDFMARLEAVRNFTSLPESKQLAAAHKRIRNILKHEGDDKADVSEVLLRERPERDLNAALKKFSTEVEQAALNGEYGSALKTLARLQAPVDTFFDKVMVMAPEPELRANRLALLRQLDKLCRSVADISCLPG
jgi:glycyl-tRNA synthetase beta chain